MPGVRSRAFSRIAVDCPLPKLPPTLLDINSAGVPEACYSHWAIQPSSIRTGEPKKSLATISCPSQSPTTPAIRASHSSPTQTATLPLSEKIPHPRSQHHHPRYPSLCRLPRTHPLHRRHGFPLAIPTRLPQTLLRNPNIVERRNSQDAERNIFFRTRSHMGDLLQTQFRGH